MDTKIRVLVFHEDSKFMVLISPNKTVRQLKDELLETYRIISGGQIVTEEISNNLHLLAYDGFILCDEFLLFDALYDGCIVTTTSRTNSDSSSSHRCCSCHSQTFTCSHAIQPFRSPFYTQLQPPLHSYQNPWISPFNPPYYLPNHLQSAATAVSVDSNRGYVATQSAGSCNVQSSAVETPSNTCRLTPRSLQSSQRDNHTRDNSEAPHDTTCNQVTDTNGLETNSPIQKENDCSNEKDVSTKNSSDVYEFDDGEVPPNISSSLLKGTLSLQTKTSDVVKKSRMHRTEDGNVTRNLIPLRLRKRKLKSGAGLSTKKSWPTRQAPDDKTTKKSQLKNVSKASVKQKCAPASDADQDGSSLSSSWSSIEEDKEKSKAKPENTNEQTVGHQVPMNSSSSKENSVTKKMTLSMKRGNDVSSSSDSEEEDDTLSKTGHVEEKDKVKEGNPSSRESTNNSTHVVNPGKNMIIEEEELSSDSSTSSDEEDKPDDDFEGKKQSSQTFRALANDIEKDSSRNASTRKRLQKTSLFNKRGPLSIEKPSTPKVSRRANGSVTNRSKVLQRKSLSQEETQAVEPLS